MPSEWSRPLPDERWWRGPVPVPRFAFDRRGPAAHRASALVPLVAAASLAAFALVDRALAPLTGPAWSQLVALALTTAPVATCIAVMQGTAFHAAWKTGAWFAFACSAVYAWAFFGGWA